LPIAITTIIIINSSMPLVRRCCFHKVSSVSTILRSPPRSICRPMLTCLRSLSAVRVHVCLGRPRGRFQSAGGPRTAARRARRWSISGSDLAVWTRSCSRLRRIMSDAGVHSVRLQSTYISNTSRLALGQTALKRSYSTCIESLADLMYCSMCVFDCLFVYCLHSMFASFCTSPAFGCQKRINIMSC